MFCSCTFLSSVPFPLTIEITKFTSQQELLYRSTLLLSEYPQSQFSPKYQHLTVLSHLHRTPVSFFFTFVPFLLHWVQRKTKTTSISRSGQGPLHSAARTNLSNTMKMEPKKFPHKPTFIFGFLFHLHHSGLHCFFSKELPFLCTLGTFSPLDLNNGCSPSDWHHTESLFSSCSVVENRTVKVIRAERGAPSRWHDCSLDSHYRLIPISLPFCFFYSSAYSLHSSQQICTHTDMHIGTCAHTHQTDGWSSALTKAKAQGTSTLQSPFVSPLTAFSNAICTQAH